MKTRPTWTLGALALAACAAGGGGMYDQPYALFEPEQRSVPGDTRPAFVLKVDGKDRSIDSNDPVAPGMRELVVSIPGPPGVSQPGRDTLTVEAKPCMRYWLSARRSAPGARDWSAYVSGAEPIGECQKKFAAVK
jgi:hypothetical protein